MTATGPDTTPQPIVPSTDIALIIYILYFLGYFTGITAIIGVIMAHIQLDTADPMLAAFRIHVWPTSNVFKAGHQIRLEITSSKFPMWDRNPNTGHAFAQDAELKIADQVIYHDEDHPSEITLPVVRAAIE